MKQPPRTPGSGNGANSGGVPRAARRWAVVLGALLASGCQVILGADKGYYEASTESAGGSVGASASASTSAATSASAATSTSAVTSTSSGTGGGSSTSSGASSSSTSSGTGGVVNDTCWHGNPADPGGTDPCGPSSVAVLADNFNDNVVGPLWGLYEISATAMETNQQAVVSIPGAPAKFAGFVSKYAYSLLGCHGSIEVVKAPQHPNTVVHLSFSPDPSSGADLAEVRQIDKSLAFSLVTGGVATDDCVIPYLPGAHRFWRLRETGGQLLWETAPDGQAWTVRRRVKTPAFASSVRVDFGVIPLAADLAGVGVFDNFDMP